MRAVVRGGGAAPRGELRLPGDKSLAHRALMFGALADGAMTVRNLPPGGDVQSTRRCLADLGVGFSDTPDGLRISPPEQWIAGRTLDCGNSGTTTRLLAGLLAGLNLGAILDGDASLRRRPMRRVADPLRLLGASVATGLDGCLPLRIDAVDGPLQPTRVELVVASAQVKSAVLLAGLFAGGPVTVVEPQLSRDHTERMLAAMGAGVARDGLAVTVPGGGVRLRGLDLDLPGDISTAAFYLVAGAMNPDARIVVRGVGVNPTRTGILDVMQAMGAGVRVAGDREAGGEPVADLTVQPSRLVATEIGGAIIPRLIDELPILAVLATAAVGETVVRDAGELRHKESDRITTTVTQLRRLGADIDEREDGFVVRGPSRLRGAAVEAGGDHRLAMALAVAGLQADGETVIDGADAASVSHPAFWDDLRRLAGPGAVRLEAGA